MKKRFLFVAALGLMAGMACASDPVGEYVPPLSPASAACTSRLAGSIVGPIDATTDCPTAFTQLAPPFTLLYTPAASGGPGKLPCNPA